MATEYVKESDPFVVTPVLGETDEDAQVDLTANGAEATAVTIPAEALDFTYSATAEDNGTAGALDAQPGVIYNGPNGNYVRVKIANHDVVEHAIITVPEATDTVTLAVYKNSELAALSDEGYTAQNEIAIEFNLDAIVGPLNTNDVIRVALLAGGKGESVAWDVAAGTLVIQ